MTIENLFAVQVLGTVAASPNGEWIAAVVQRPQTDKETYGRPYLGGNDRADIWLVPTRGGTPSNLTNGIRDRSGFWYPRWSPDGRRLAMFSTRGGRNIHLYVWNADDQRLTRMAERGVDFGVLVDGPDGEIGLFRWLSPTTLLVGLLPEGQIATRFDALTRGPRVASREWAKIERGTEPTASVLETGSGAPTREFQMSQIQLIDVARGTRRVVASVPYFEHGARRITLSPDGRYAAMLVQASSIAMDGEHRLSQERWPRARLGVVALDDRASIRWSADTMPVYAMFSGWSPDGSQLAVVGKLDEGSDAAPDELFILKTATGAVRCVTPEGWKVVAHEPLDTRAPAVLWTIDGRAVMHARRMHPRRTAETTGLTRWLRLEPGGPAVDIATKLTRVPGALQRSREPNVYVGVSDGDLWWIDIARGTTMNLTADFAPAVTSIVSTGPLPAVGASAELILATVDHGSSGYARVSLTGGGAGLLPSPGPRASLKAFMPERELALFVEVGPSGTFLWRGDGRAAQFTRLLALNEQLAGIADIERRLITYHGIDGDTLTALLLLPSSYDSTKRYPLIAWVYAGEVVTDTLGFQKNDVRALNLVPLVERGYGILIPSMPLRSEHEPGDPYIDLPKGAMPAIDRAVELGIADPNRLGVMGQSFGGYSAYSLMTYTTRFKAAVVMAGLSDLVSLYGQFDVRDRFTETPHDELFQATLAEGGQTRMGAAPWQNLWRYLRNTPLLFVDRVETPVMIIQGDQDQVSMTQGEEFFTALHRQGKRAKFIRYWGEGHVIGTPANVRHMWQEIFAWFDTYLRFSNPTGSAGDQNVLPAAAP